jgi:TPR repeat protein
MLGLIIELLATKHGIQKNESISTQSYKISTNSSDADTQFTYALLLSKGNGIPMNKSTAADCHKLAADQGQMEAQNQ